MEVKDIDINKIRAIDNVRQRTSKTEVTELRICTIVAILLTVVLVALYVVLTDAAYEIAGTEYKYVVDGIMPAINSIYIITICIGGFTTSILVYLNLIKFKNKNPEVIV